VKKKNQDCHEELKDKLMTGDYLKYAEGPTESTSRHNGFTIIDLIKGYIPTNFTDNLYAIQKSEHKIKRTTSKIQETIGEHMLTTWQYRIGKILEWEEKQKITKQMKQQKGKDRIKKNLKKENKGKQSYTNNIKEQYKKGLNIATDTYIDFIQYGKYLIDRFYYNSSFN